MFQPFSQVKFDIQIPEVSDLTRILQISCSWEILNEYVLLIFNTGFLLWLVLSGVRGSLYRALGLMVAASPCALAVAPLAYATAVSACAKKVTSLSSLCLGRGLC